MIQKYFFGKCGGENCPQRYKTVKMGQGTLSTSYDFIFECNIDRKENPDCQNCPHGKTLEEMAKEMAEKGYREIRDYTLRRLVAWQDLRRSKKNRLIEIELLKLKALLGGAEK